MKQITCVFSITLILSGCGMSSGSNTKTLSSSVDADRGVTDAQVTSGDTVVGETGAMVSIEQIATTLAAQELREKRAREIGAVFQKVVGREPSAEELETALSQLEQGKSLGAIQLELSLTDESILFVHQTFKGNGVVPANVIEYWRDRLKKGLPFDEFTGLVKNTDYNLKWYSVQHSHCVLPGGTPIYTCAYNPSYPVFGGCGAAMNLWIASCNPWAPPPPPNPLPIWGGFPRA